MAKPRYGIGKPALSAKPAIPPRSNRLINPTAEAFSQQIGKMVQKAKPINKPRRMA